ncbi:uncharacterized protein LOC127751155, partial [Frankliniella occidentalis]|uniref:Uncharacterized protein LOC127751155 n=1 Tax=Frankliniella occidentalis TaxID=133901 RepID=A0A9C6X6U8_FRAOC
MGRGAGPARSLAARVALGLCFALACSAAGDTTTWAPKDVCPEPPTRELVCYYEGSTPVSRLDACLCTSVVFTDVASKAGDGFKVDIGVRSEVRALRKRNPWVRALLQLQVGAAQLKSEERRQRASQAVSAALRKATVDGVELDLDWSHHGAANKSHLTAFVKAVRFQLDSADAVDRRRAKRDYEIFERVTKSVSTTEAATAADTDADTDATESTEPTTSETSGTASDTAADTAGTVTDDE